MNGQESLESYENAYSEALWCTFIRSNLNGITRLKSNRDIVFGSFYTLFPAKILTCEQQQQKS